METTTKAVYQELKDLYYQLIKHNLQPETWLMSKHGMERLSNELRYLGIMFYHDAVVQENSYLSIRIRVVEGWPDDQFALIDRTTYERMENVIWNHMLWQIRTSPVIGPIHLAL